MATVVATAPARVYSGPYAAQVNAAAKSNGLDPFLLAGLFSHESSFDPSAVSSTGDVGIAQINLASHPDVTRAQALNPTFSIGWAARYLAALKAKFGGSTVAALRAYNTGSGQPSTTGNAYATAVIQARSSILDQVKKLVGYVAPVPGAKEIRLDQGIDYQGTPGNPVVAIGNAVVDAVKSDPGGFGRVVYYTLTDGPQAGQQIYVGHAAPTVTAGQKVTAGQRVATLLQNPLGNATQPGWAEVGFASGGAPVSHSESDTTSASKFASWLNRIPTPLNPLAPIFPNQGGLPSVPDPRKIITGPYDALASVGTAFSHFLDDPAYPFLWLGLMVMGLALVFVGMERLLGRSAGADARRAAVTSSAAVAAPEEAPVLVGA